MNPPRKPAQEVDPPAGDPTKGTNEVRSRETVIKAGALQNAMLNSANFSSIATDEKGVIQIFNIGAERMPGYAAAEVINRITPAGFKASRGIEDIHELTCIRKDGSRFPAVVSVTALRDADGGIIGYPRRFPGGDEGAQPRRDDPPAAIRASRPRATPAALGESDFQRREIHRRALRSQNRNRLPES